MLRASLLALLMATSASATLATDSWAADPQAALDATFARWNSDAAPGCAVGVAENGVTVARRAWGMAELEHGIKATPDTIYEAGSVSKQFTAAAIILLAQDGALSLDDDIRRFLPEMPDYGTPITLRNLINHTSGLRDWGSIGSLEGWPRSSRAAGNDNVLEIAARQKELNFAPGSHYLYSNTGYNLLAIVVQRASGRSLSAFTAERIFKPLGMTHSRWRDDYTAIVPGRAAAYDREADGYHEAMPFENAYGNGGLLTTVDDLLIWNQALTDDKLGVAFTEAMLQRGEVTPHRPIAYASGIVHLEHRGFEELSHSGSTGGYRAWLARYPAQKLSVAMLCNTGEAGSVRLGRAIADAFLPTTAATSYTPAAPAPTGLYAEGRTGEPLFVATGADGGVTADGEALVPIGPGRWTMGADVLEFDADGGLVRVTREGERLPYVKRDAVTPTRAVLADMVGAFVSDEAMSRLSVAQTAEGLSIGRVGWPATSLTPAYHDVFTGHIGVVSFERDSAGKVTGLRINNGRAQNVLFVRQPS
ncbi:serine hydrolase domain-containing protein [Brevundimonas sp.]|jgi:CubicO group peptidase (beta-lactamase class C family)|uniref:serine hydrolase domain-containing protein n=1 Tax=Brevundimonas sp. TaxID=1871086 RepID=UPI0037C17B84